MTWQFPESCQASEIREVAMDWTCDQDGRDEKHEQNSSGENYQKTVIWNVDMGQ